MHNVMNAIIVLYCIWSPCFIRYCSQLFCMSQLSEDVNASCVSYIHDTQSSCVDNA